MSDMVRLVPPHNEEAEKSVLACMLYDNDCVEEALSLLDPEDFYDPSFRKIFEALGEVTQKSLPADMIHVQEALMKMDVDPSVYSLDSLKTIISAAFTSQNLKSYCVIVKDKAVKRKLIAKLAEIQNEAYRDKEDSQELIEKSGQAVFGFFNERQEESGNTEQAAIRVLSRAEQAAVHPEELGNVSSGFYDLDAMLNGFKKSDLIVIAARPSMGKTALALNIAERIMLRQKKKVMMFSLEMSEDQLVQRLLSQMSGVPSQKIDRGQMSDEEWDRLIEAGSSLKNEYLKIADKGAITVSEIRSRCRRQKMENGLDIVIIDYLQLIGSDVRSESRQIEIAEISRALKALAKELNVPVIALSQLSRAPEMRADHRPMLADLRESGSIEQDADVVMFLYRDEVYNPASEEKGTAEIIISKHRNGPVGTVKTAWVAEQTKFADLAR